MSEHVQGEVLYRLERNERDIGELTKLVSATSETVHVFDEGMKHFRETFDAHEIQCKDETNKVNTLWDARNKNTGQWDVVSAICATICGGGGLYAMVELVNHLMK